MLKDYLYKLVWHGWGRENECIVIRERKTDYFHERFSYKDNAWVRDDETWFRKVINSSDSDTIDEDEAREIVERFGGDFYAG